MTILIIIINMYITLASNVSKTTFGNVNTASNFTNVLPELLDFRHDSWEVGVKKLIYHNKFDTIVNETFKVKTFNRKSIKTLLSTTAKGHYFQFNSGKIIISNNLPHDYKILFSPKLYTTLPNNAVYRVAQNDVITDHQKQKEYELKYHSNNFTASDYVIENYTEITNEIYNIIPGSYSNVQTILEQINLKCKATKFIYNHERVSVKFKKHSEIIKNPHSDIITIEDRDMEHVTLLNGLHYILGFENTLLNKDERAKFAPQLKRGLFAIFIYSNICAYSSVGDIMAPLLHVTSTPKSEEGQIVSIDIVDPMYIPVAYNTVSQIEIKLTGDTGDDLPFYGDTTKTILTLHFRQKL